MPFTPAARYDAPWSDTVLVLAPGSIPTVDYYVSPRLAGLTTDRLLRADSRSGAPCSAPPAGTFVVIVRHAGMAWLDWLGHHRASLSGVAYLMDDDIPGAWHCRDVPLDYALWTSGRYWRTRGRLAEVCDRLWVSTPELARRYPGAVVIPPLPFEVEGEAAPMRCRRWGYHGTRVHHRELRWLVPIVEAVQQAVPEAEFEVFGGASVRRLFANVPRVTVRPPLPWPDYVVHCRQSPLAVGLAPLLPGYFNAARSQTKLFDILRCGAVGLFSDRALYAEVLGGSGVVLLPDDHKQWIEWSVRLLQDDDLRQKTYRHILQSTVTSARRESLASWIAREDR